MNYFLDTNVEIGYVFCTDPWNNETVKFFDSEDKLHSSFYVEKEFQKKFSMIFNEQKKFLISLVDELKNSSNKLLSFKDLKIKSKIIPLKNDFAENKKEQIVKVIWKLSKSKHENNDALNTEICNVNVLVLYIEKFIRNFRRKLIERRNNFESKVIFHPKRDEKYMEINEKLLYDGGIHYPDNCIILDAHHLAYTNYICLEFVINLIKKADNMIDCLCISKFHNLKDFVSKI